MYFNLKTNSRAAISDEHAILNAIIEAQKALQLTDKELLSGIMNTTTWWRIRNHQSDISLSHALKLFGRVNLSWELYRPKQIVASSANITNG